MWQNLKGAVLKTQLMFKKFFNSSPEIEQQQALIKLEVSKIQRLIANKEMDVNKTFTDKKLTPLHYAVKCIGKTELLEYLLRQKNINIDARDAYGETPLMHAAKAGECNACCLLIKYGANYKLKSPLSQKDALEVFQGTNYKFLSDKIEIAIKERATLIESDNIKIEPSTTMAVASPRQHYYGFWCGK